MTATYCERLTDRFEKLAAEGLVDVKFLLRNTDEAVVEEVCREVNDLLDAYERGDCEDMVFNDAPVSRSI